MFIAFDGVDGAGKSTQIEIVKNFLTMKGHNVISLDMGSAKYFKDYLKDISSKQDNIDKRTRELVYYFEGLYVNLNIIQQVKQTDFVLIDRYYLSYLAYGPLNGVPKHQVEYFTKNLIEPDLYFYFDLPISESYKRITSYREIDLPEVGFEKIGDTSFISFQNKVRANYLNNLTNKHIIINAMENENQISRRILDEIQKVFRI